jgi:hypothetical protein
MRQTHRSMTRELKYTIEYETCNPDFSCVRESHRPGINARRPLHVPLHRIKKDGKREKNTHVENRIFLQPRFTSYQFNSWRPSLGCRARAGMLLRKEVSISLPLFTAHFHLIQKSACCTLGYIAGRNVLASRSDMIIYGIHCRKTIQALKARRSGRNLKCRHVRKVHYIT